MIGIPEGARPTAARRALRALPSPDEDDAEALLGWLVGLTPTRDEAAILARLEGQARQSRAGVVLRALLTALARRVPHVVVVEDVHWIDASSARLLAAALPATTTAPLVICVTTRRESTPASERLERAIDGLPEIRPAHAGARRAGRGGAVDARGAHARRPDP